MGKLEQAAIEIQEQLLEVRFRETGSRAYLVSLVIVLRIVLKHSRSLLVVESPHQVVGAESFAPVLVVREPSIDTRIRSVRVP